MITIWFVRAHSGYTNVSCSWKSSLCSLASFSQWRHLSFCHSWDSSDDLSVDSWHEEFECTFIPRGLCVEDVLWNGEGLLSRMSLPLGSTPPCEGDSGGVSKYHFEPWEGGLGLFVPERELPAIYPLLNEEFESLFLLCVEDEGTVSIWEVWLRPQPELRERVFGESDPWAESTNIVLSGDSAVILMCRFGPALIAFGEGLILGDAGLFDLSGLYHTGSGAASLFAEAVFRNVSAGSALFTLLKCLCAGAGLWLAEVCCWAAKASCRFRGWPVSISLP